MKTDMTINIIGDIAGRYDELLLLLEKMPKADLILSVGDLVDRGPKSKEVIDFFMNTPNAEAVYGNHEDLMMDAIETDNTHIWYLNGGFQTVLSYGSGLTTDVDRAHLEWLRNRPLYFENETVFISHAPLWYPEDLPERFARGDQNVDSFIWNRQRPLVKYKDKFMVYGHNGRILDVFTKQGEQIAKCIDNSHAQQLAGMHWPTKEMFLQDYL